MRSELWRQKRGPVAHALLPPDRVQVGAPVPADIHDVVEQTDDGPSEGHVHHTVQNEGQWEIYSLQAIHHDYGDGQRGERVWLHIHVEMRNFWRRHEDDEHSNEYYERPRDSQAAPAGGVFCAVVKGPARSGAAEVVGAAVQRRGARGRDARRRLAQQLRVTQRADQTHVAVGEYADGDEVAEYRPETCERLIGDLVPPDDSRVEQVHRCVVPATSKKKCVWHCHLKII